MSRHVVTVFGGSGFLGRHLVRRLAQTGAIVRVATRDPVGAALLKPMGDVGQIVPVYADLTNRSQIDAAVAGAGTVINLVGILFERGRATFDAIHTEGAGAVASAAAAAGVGQLVHISALGASADSPSAYARSKVAGEVAVREAFPTAVILRPSVIFGPEDNFFNLFAGIMRLSPFLPVFESRFQPVYVGDVADAAMKALTGPLAQGKTFEIGGPTVYSFRELMELLLSVTARRRLLVPMPFGLASFAAWFLQLLPNPLLTCDQVKQLQRDNIVGEGAATLADLGIAPTPAEAILPSYLARYRLPTAPWGKAA